MAINLTQLKPHVVSRDLSGYLTFIYGAPKTGKTTFSSQMPKPLLIAAERGYNAIPGIIAQDVTSWSEFKQTFRELKKKEVKELFDSIIIDTVDILADMCQKYIMNQQNIEDMGDLGYGKAWTLFKNEFNEVFRGLTQLGYAVVFLGHDKEQILEDGTRIIRPSLSNATRSIITGMSDIIGYAYQAGPGQMSHLKLRAEDGSVICGSRVKYMPSDIVFTYDNLSNALGEALDKEAAEFDNKFITNEKVENQPTLKEYDLDGMKAEFNEITSQLMAENEDNRSKIVEIVEKYLGKGNKASDATMAQGEHLELIILEVKELLS